MAETEGVVQFGYNLARPGAPLPDDVVRPLLAWRSVLRRLTLVGQSPGRYAGLGYGNISRRVPGGADSFIITASQTSGIAGAGPGELVLIRRVDLRRFRVEAEGALPPSSETMTHAMIYTAGREVNWVLHGHSPEIWENARAAGLPAIGADIGYGSPEMAEAVAALLRDDRERPLAFATLGHRDGVFACGAGAGETGGKLVRVLARCLSLAARSGPADVDVDKPDEAVSASSTAGADSAVGAATSTVAGARVRGEPR